MRSLLPLFVVVQHGPGMLHNKCQIESHLVQCIFSGSGAFTITHITPGTTDAEPAQYAREVAGSIPHWAGGVQTREQRLS